MEGYIEYRCVKVVVGASGKLNLYCLQLTDGGAEPCRDTGSVCVCVCGLDQVQVHAVHSVCMYVC